LRRLRLSPRGEGEKKKKRKKKRGNTCLNIISFGFVQDGRGKPRVYPDADQTNRGKKKKGGKRRGKEDGRDLG